MERVNVWNTYDLERQKSCFTFAEDYRRFISENKTERECVDSFVNAAEDAGYVELSRAIEEAEKNGKKLQPGDKVPVRILHGEGEFRRRFDGRRLIVSNKRRVR